MSGNSCAMEGCGNRPVGEWRAHWSLFDFDEFPTCEEHWFDVGQAIKRRTVDGIDVQELYFQRWWCED